MRSLLFSTEAEWKEGKAEYMINNFRPAVSVGHRVIRQGWFAKIRTNQDTAVCRNSADKKVLSNCFILIKCYAGEGDSQKFVVTKNQIVLQCNLKSKVLRFVAEDYENSFYLIKSTLKWKRLEPSGTLEYSNHQNTELLNTKFIWMLEVYWCLVCK